VETTPDGKRRLVCEDGEALIVEEHTVLLLRSLRVREHLWQVVAPIERDGVDTVALGTDERIDAVVTREQAAWFVPPPADETVVHEDERTMAFSIVSLSFKECNKWRLYDGATTIHATISDAGFLSRVDQNVERFAKGDLLVCKVRVRQWQTAFGVRTDYEVVEVLEHRQAARQIRLPLEE